MRKVLTSVKMRTSTDTLRVVRSDTEVPAISSPTYCGWQRTRLEIQTIALVRCAHPMRFKCSKSLVKSNPNLYQRRRPHSREKARPQSLLPLGQIRR